MTHAQSLVACMAFAAGAFAAATYPPKPADLATPVQQRIAIDGPNSELHSKKQNFDALVLGTRCLP
ncbi:hypothetical protein LEL_02539 [Akanthomyces lecanii RCEF 1005]|uniref:Uncharacterized protein n=1 Tax=Akanthomyces lecanii RCEF 1005 TaxID=1081108 RepID=A0A162KA20_CORDF|nr:hypothetical protein LEL_02539 [Akanthomyces lecanii RCEF 1005]